jgi:hypothetical protein
MSGGEAKKSIGAGCGLWRFVSSGAWRGGAGGRGLQIVEVVQALGKEKKKAYSSVCFDLAWERA